MKYRYITILLLTIFIVAGCKKKKEEEEIGTGNLRITFLDVNNNSPLKDTLNCSAGDKISFKVAIESGAGLASIQYKIEVVTMFDEIIGEGSLGNKTKHEFIVDYVLPANTAGHTQKFKFKVTDNSGKTVTKDRVALIRAANGDYISYFTPKETETVYNNTPCNYDFAFFSTYGAPFLKLEVTRRINGGSPTLIDTKLPNEVRSGLGANYKYSVAYVPAFATNSTNTVKTEFKIIQMGDVVESKTHTLVVINN